jgi:hypothetical protein
MALWLLSHIPTWGLTLLFVGGITSLAILGSLFTHRCVPILAAGGHNDAAGVLLGIWGAIYGIILAFVIVILWEQYESAESLVSTETVSLAQFVRDSKVFPPQTQAILNNAVSEYVHAVVEDEWPLMKRGLTSTRARVATDGIYTVLQGYQPETANQISFYDEAVSNLDDVASSRRARLDQSRTELPTLLQILIICGAFIVIVLTYLFGSDDRRIQLFFVGTIAALVAFALLLTVVLDRPFTGDLSVSSEGFKLGVLAQYWPPQHTSVQGG